MIPHVQMYKIQTTKTPLPARHVSGIGGNLGKRMTKQKIPLWEAVGMLLVGRAIIVAIYLDKYNGISYDDISGILEQEEAEKRGL